MVPDSLVGSSSPDPYPWLTRQRALSVHPPHGFGLRTVNPPDQTRGSPHTCFCPENLLPGLPIRHLIVSLEL